MVESTELSVGFLLAAGTAGMLLLVVSLVVYVVFYQRKVSKQQEKHQHGLLSATIEAQERERTRVAEELHDGVQQEIAALKLKVERANRKVKDSDGEVKTLLKEAAAEAEDTVDSLRRISYDLLPHSLKTLGLAELLGSLCDGMDTGGLTACFILNGTYNRQVPEVELALYRVVQEMATNTRKHAEATAFDIVMSCKGKGLSLVVSDNGKGYDLGAKKNRGLGLRNIESRLLNIKAAYQVDSRPGQGTSITIDI